MNPKLKWILIIIAGLFIVFFITNPTYKDFEEYSADYSVSYHYEGDLLLHQTVRKKLADNLIYSIYVVQKFDCSPYGYRPTVKLTYSKRYVGFFNNFFEIKDY